MNQEQQKSAFLQSIARGTVSHAYILEGAQGIGKKTMGRFMAAALHCSGEEVPCRGCPSCVKHGANSHPDYCEISREAKRATVSVDQIRQVIKDIYIKPFLAEKKVYFFTEADDITPQGQNALLKVFEEPPPFAVILLAAQNADNLLPTIRSRAVQFSLSPWTREQICRFVQERYQDKAQLAGFIADFSGGIVGRAKEVCESEDFLTLRSGLFTKLLRLSGGERAAYEAADYLAANKDAADTLFDLLLGFFRDALMAKVRPGCYTNGDFQTQIEAFASNFTARELSLAVSRAAALRTQMSKNANYGLWAVDLLINCWEELHGTSSRSQV